MSSKLTFSNSTARSYALALYELSKEDAELDKNTQDVKNLNKLLDDSDDLKESLTNPTVSKEIKKNVLSIIAEKSNFSKNLKNFISFVADKNRLFFLDKIIKSFLNLVSKSKGESEAILISAKKLSAEEKEKIKIEMSQNFKSSLNIDYKYDPSLIAGLIIQIGSVMVDASIKTKLKKLEKSMIGI